MMIDYIIKKTDNRLYIAEDNYYLVKDISFQKAINKILINQLTNINALESTTKKMFGFKNKIPLYIDTNTLLMCINSYRLENTMYFNYHSIKSYEDIDKDLIVIFCSGHCLKIKATHSFKAQIIKCKQILDKIRK